MTTYDADYNDYDADIRERQRKNFPWVLLALLILVTALIAIKSCKL